MPSALLSLSHVIPTTVVTDTIVIIPISRMRKPRLRSRSLPQLTKIKSDQLVYDKNSWKAAVCQLLNSVYIKQHKNMATKCKQNISNYSSITCVFIPSQVRYEELQNPLILWLKGSSLVHKNWSPNSHSNWYAAEQSVLWGSFLLSLAIKIHHTANCLNNCEPRRAQC